MSAAAVTVNAFRVYGLPDDLPASLVHLHQAQIGRYVVYLSHSSWQQGEDINRFFGIEPHLAVVDDFGNLVRVQ